MKKKKIDFSVTASVTCLGNSNRPVLNSHPLLFVERAFISHLKRDTSTLFIHWMPACSIPAWFKDHIEVL